MYKSTHLVEILQNYVNTLRRNCICICSISVKMDCVSHILKSSFKPLKTYLRLKVRMLESKERTHLFEYLVVSMW